MRLQALALLVSLLLIVHSVPTHINRNSAFIRGKRDWINNCGNSSFHNQSSEGSPAVSDCQQITTNIAGGRTWTVWALNRTSVHSTNTTTVKFPSIYYRKLASYGTCAFGAYSQDGGARVGTSDIIDLINDSINRFQWSGMVGAKGSMKCQSLNYSDVGVYWAIYHT
ncbi:hypothetical protein P170DRAFT_429776 [Aspergillus steynii IBT 23096]|uniref:Ecp2 effector protein-like domain-containing protein n=1 Tax=Aspergillus steynii IBT 23096 TaxID=1392250 RepID=A0A2I2FWX9_9EURO|nr:uncharacterized protein P170DRAFT_429776 [Aspergillus steynii IBT 23096]PLB45066.1 hypothetical protein P170DRAFT_429776 [Aspergillus steynii IBT 23096]